MAELFTKEELQEIERRANQVAQEHGDDPSLREALQLLAEAAANVARKLPRVTGV